MISPLRAARLGLRRRRVALAWDPPRARKGAIVARTLGPRRRRGSAPRPKLRRCAAQGSYGARKQQFVTPRVALRFANSGLALRPTALYLWKNRRGTREGPKRTNTCACTPTIMEKPPRVHQYSVTRVFLREASSPLGVFKGFLRALRFILSL